MSRAFVTGLKGTVLSADERAFLAEAAPWGLILFRRNVEDPDQLRRLTGDFREAVGWSAPVLVDQEGGRVQRLTAPHWRKYPSGRRLAGAAALAGDVTLVADVAHLIGDDLAAVGIDVDCAPCLDIATPDMTPAIGDRSYGERPDLVAAAGRAFADGLKAAGLLPVIKHVPGHGRARVDSHHELPVVEADLDSLAATDFMPFAALADLPAAMTAHLVYTAIDPDRPATQSPVVIEEIIRGRIGFDGLLFSDDLSMNALKGTIAERARATLAAGCDIALHCSGDMAEMVAVAAETPELVGKAAARAERALKGRAGSPHDDADGVLARLDAALAAYDATV
ncbi:beta-N-acetylhexosaminidase [Pleomorphomonas diazotrophica]|uniref:beta-N-acetylhexosaminidase n=1 Tax=Pleomorphomonas diazotrophica TaxID=1166257 RepID=A0A1I4Q8X6_9HYPH|nr:beta-N-acetylhexosaminidase [Pleomorphomonas diazotrophica]PKR90853.1 beta-N-acetylhexosaminidase [Pleomorphomonas diazotrophica]SFM36548.1 beta-N-acetylhexosaminidase [Pleomorphomonas diazotrophica]